MNQDGDSGPRVDPSSPNRNDVNSRAVILAPRERLPTGSRDKPCREVPCAPCLKECLGRQDIFVYTTRVRTTPVHLVSLANQPVQ